MTDTADAPVEATSLDDLPRAWRGRAEIGGRSLRIRLLLPEGGGTGVVVDHVDAGVMAIPVDGVRWESGRLTGEAMGGPLELRLVAPATLAGHHDGPTGRSSLTLSAAREAFLEDVTPRLDDAGRRVTAFARTTPPDTGDGWRIAPEPTARVDLEPLLDLGQRIVDDTYPRVDDVLVARGDELVFEEYFHARRPEQLHTIQSCTKSVTALVFGLAVDSGDVGDLQDPVWRYLRHRTGTRWIDERYDITVQQLLAMSGGLDWNEDVHYTDPRNDNTRMNLSDDWIGYVLNRPRRPDWPPTRYEYQSGLALLLGEVLRAATGRSVIDLARDGLFGPLGIVDFVWYANAHGVVHTGGGLSLRPRDLLKLGRLVLRRGDWEGRRILSSEWIDRILREQSSSTTTRWSYQWLVGSTDVGGRTIDRVQATGYGGQALHVIPALDAVAVSNATDYYGDGAYLRILEEHVLPALVGA